MAMVPIAFSKKFGEECVVDYHPPGALGAPKGDCDDGLLCNGGICKYDMNHSCSKNDDCGEVMNICYEGFCKREGTDGMPCKSLYDCYGGKVCNNGFCGNRNYLPIGSKCQSIVECEYDCENNVCVGRAPTGGCTNDGDCPSVI
ncbi:unnamed protein product [Cunninghamella echinulata]